MQLSPLLFVCLGFFGCLNFFTCPFKEAEGKCEGLQQSWTDVGAQSEGAGPLAINRGETGNAGVVHPLSPSLLGRLHLPPKVSASPRR